ncbi:MAG: hypothetical protein ABL958_20835, partial [Bdellovibrionia bacterium]
MKTIFTVLVCLLTAQLVGPNGHLGFSEAAAQANERLSEESAALAKKIDAAMYDLQQSRISGARLTGADLDAQNVKLRAMKAELLVLGRQFFTSIGAEVEDIIMNEEGSARKHPSLKVKGGKGMFARFVALKSSQNDGMIVVFNPSGLSTGKRKAIYDTTDNSLSIAWNMDDVVTLKNPEMFHELTHAILTRLAYHQGTDTVYASVLKKLSPVNMNDGINTYMEIFTVQEFATYAAEVVQVLQQAKSDSVAERQRALPEAIVRRVMPAYFAGLDAIEGTQALLSGIESGSTKIGADTELMGEGIGRHIVVQNELYKYYFSFPPNLADEQVT